MDSIQELYVVLATTRHRERGVVEGLAASGHAVTGLFPLITADLGQLQDRIIPAAQEQANLTRTTMQVVRFLRCETTVVIQPE